MSKDLDREEAFKWLQALRAGGGPHAARASTVLSELARLEAQHHSACEFLSEIVSDQLDPSVNVWWMRCSPGLGVYVRDLELAARIPAAVVFALRTCTWSEPDLSMVIDLVRQWLAAEGFVRPELSQTAPTHDPAVKRPRVFYYEEAEDAWCPADGLAVENIVGPENFLYDGEVVRIRFKRIDMTDAEMATLPSD